MLNYKKFFKLLCFIKSYYSLGELMFEIIDIKARMVLDSRGNPTVEAEVFTQEQNACAIVPSGASTGKYEAHELRDNKKPFFGKGVTKALKNVRKIKKSLKGISVVKQEEIDKIMLKLDNTKNKKKLGANAILAVSLACARCAAKCLQIPLWSHIATLAETNPKHIKIPVPYSNIINGGVHSGNSLMFQEFMIVPNAKTMKTRIRIMSEFYHQLKKTLKERYGPESVGVGDEGGFAPNMFLPNKVLELLLEVKTKLKYKKEVSFAIDVAASEIYDDKKEKYEVAKGLILDKKELIDYYEMLISKYPLISIEDPFAEDDFEGFHKLMLKLKKDIEKKKIQVVGDDLLVTNPARIEIAHKDNLCNALLLKVNQIGTLTEALEAAKLARSYEWNIMVSHRSGDTEDTFIADLAVGLGCGQIKAGAPCRSERTSKYNRLLRIEDELKYYK